MNTELWPQTGKELLSVDLEYLCTKARTSKLITPRYDIDNLIKLTLDCITSTGLIWTDDVSVVTLRAHKRFRDPKTEDAGTLLRLHYDNN